MDERAHTRLDIRFLRRRTSGVEPVVLALPRQRVVGIRPLEPIPSGWYAVTARRAEIGRMPGIARLVLGTAAAEHS